MLLNRTLSIAVAGALAALASAARAQDYRNDIGYARLSAELGAGTPNGTGVSVTHVEADLTTGGTDYYPDTTSSEFTGKTLTAHDTPATVSSHATTVGAYFYGNNTSMTPGVTTVNNYEAGHWIQSDFLHTGSTTFLPNATTDRVANHSYIGSFGSVSLDTEALTRLDYVIQHDEFINVVAVNNGGSSGANPLLAGSFNAISVGLTDGSAASGTTALSGIYVAGRAAPLVVAPTNETSYATPIVASTATLLVQYAHANPALSSGAVTSARTGLTLRYAETADVIKAAIMAGADRVTNNTVTGTNITDYGNNAFATQNGLDFRYGAGQVDVYNSYHIIAAGQQAPGTIQTKGFDYQPANPNASVEDYRFTGDSGVTAALVWNAHVDNSLNATLAHFVLSLLQVNGDGSTTPITTSASTIDNTQNLFLTNLSPANTYELEVTRTDSLGAWDYGLAWNLTAVPEPGAASILLAVVSIRLLRRRSS